MLEIQWCFVLVRLFLFFWKGHKKFTPEEAKKHKLNKSTNVSGLWKFHRILLEDASLSISLQLTRYIQAEKEFLKSDSHLSKKCVIRFVESPLKMMKNAFYFILKSLSVLKIFKFLSWLFGHVETNGLNRKIRLISKFMTSQPG